jgi:hypothetical protein
LNSKAQQESQVWKFRVGIEVGTLTASYDPKHSITWLQRLFTDLHAFTLEEVKDYAAERGLTSLQAREELRKRRDKDVQKCVGRALKIMRAQMRTAIDDALRLFVTEEVPLQVLRDLNGQTSMGKMRLPRFKGGSRSTRATADELGGDGSITAAMEGVAQQYCDKAKERMGVVRRGRPLGSREGYEDEAEFLSDLRDAIKKLITRGRRPTKIEVADELRMSAKTLNRRLATFQIDFKEEVKR